MSEHQVIFFKGYIKICACACMSDLVWTNSVQVCRYDCGWWVIQCSFLFNGLSDNPELPISDGNWNKNKNFNTSFCVSSLSDSDGTLICDAHQNWVPGEMGNRSDRYFIRLRFVLKQIWSKQVCMIRFGTTFWSWEPAGDGCLHGFDPSNNPSRQSSLQVAFDGLLALLFQSSLTQVAAGREHAPLSPLKTTCWQPDAWTLGEWIKWKTLSTRRVVWNTKLIWMMPLSWTMVVTLPVENVKKPMSLYHQDLGKVIKIFFIVFKSRLIAHQPVYNASVIPVVTFITFHNA